MANDIIKSFVQKQTTPISIGVPKQRTQETQPSAPAVEPAAPIQSTAAEAPKQENSTPARRPGRPKQEVDKVKMSLYIPVEAREELLKIQHNTFTSSFNDVVLCAINEFIKNHKA